MATQTITQDYVFIILEYKKNVSGIIESATMEYVDPDGVSGIFPVTHNPAKKQFIYENPKGNFLKIGKWKVRVVAIVTGEKRMETLWEIFEIKTQ
jgi:hypothetical protein